MADTTPLAPTDDEIMELAKMFITRVGSHWENADAIPDNGRIEDFARAVLVLDKWGQQATQDAVGEVVWAAGVPNSIREVHLKKWDLPIGTKLYTSPQAAHRGESAALVSHQGRIERHSDMSVLVTFPSCHLASAFENVMKGVAAQGVPAAQESKQ